MADQPPESPHEADARTQGGAASHDTWRRVVLENALDAVIGVDQHDRVVDWNRQAEVTFGWTKEEAIGRSLCEMVVPPELRERCRRGLEQFGRGDEADFVNRRLELEALDRKGHRFPVELTILPIRADGVLLFYSFIRDISDRRRQETLVRETEGALHSREQLLRLITDALPAFVAYLDRDERYQFINSAYARWFGESASAFVGRRIDEVLGEEFAQRARPHLQQALGGARVRYENQLRRPDGRMRWLEIEYVPDRGDDGSVRGVVVLGHDVSERKQAEERLRASELRFRTFFEQTPLSAQLLAADGRTLRVNRAWEELWQFAPEEIERSVLDSYNPLEDPQLEAKGITPHLRRGFAGEVARIPPILYDPAESGKPGRPRWVRAIVYPLRAPDGSVREVVLMHEDVTEQVVARKAVRESEERFRLLVEAVQDYAIYVLDPAGRVASWNVGAQRIHGFRADEIAGRSIAVFSTPEAVAQGLPERALEQARREGRHEEEGWRLRKDGSLFWSNTVLTALRGEEGIRGFSVVTRDVTARRQADEERQRLLSTIESSTDLIALADPQQRVLYVNPAGRRMLGVAGDDALEGSVVADYFTPEEFERIRHEVLPHTFREGRWQGEANVLNRRTGATTPVQMHVFAVRDQQGEVIAVANVSRDMTALKQAQQRLEEAVRARDEFISICSHELKTPVTSLKLQFQLASRQLRRGDPEVYAKERVQKRVDLVLRQLDGMSKLIEDMLDASRVATGRLHLVSERFDLRVLVGAVVDRFSEQFAALRIPVETALAPDPVEVVGDHYRLEQVVANLLTNAIKYGAGRPLKVSVERREGRARVVVEDHGIGIAPESLDKIFQRYERAIPAKHISGLGLGLYISRQIVEAHGGTIRAESALGKGSTFLVELPPG